MSIRVIVIAVVSLAVATSAIGQAILNVPSTYPTIQAAIDAAQNGDEVRIAPGTYSGTGNRDVDTGGKTVSLVGSGGAAVTVVDAQANAGSPHRGVTVSGGSGVVIRGITVRNGFGLGGGGLAIYGASNCSLDDVTFNANIADHGGGIEVDYGATVTVQNSHFQGNTATVWRGGGAYVSGQSHATFSNCQFTGNAAGPGGGAMGGGLQLNAPGSSVVVTGCSFSGNSADWGGGAGVDAGSGVFTNCSFTNNIDTLNYSSGGGLLVVGGANVTLGTCTFNGNHASIGGGLAVRYGAAVTATGCQFTNNVADGNDSWGGAIGLTDGVTAILNNCTVSGNSGNWGGGIRCFLSHLQVTGGSISTNQALNLGGAILVDGGATLSESTVTLQGVTLAANTCTAGAGGAIFGNGLMTVTATSTTFQGNTAFWSGGAIELGFGAVGTLNTCSLTSNSAGAGGGGLSVVGDATVTLHGTHVDQNTSASWGAGIVASENASRYPTVHMDGGSIAHNTAAGQGAGLVGTGSATLTFSGVDISNNTSGDSGGGARLAFGAIATFDHCTMNQNSAMSGGGAVITLGGTAQFTDSSISGNTAAYGGGGLTVDTIVPSGATLQLVRCRLQGNHATQDGGAVVAGATAIEADDCLLTANQAGGCGPAFVVHDTTMAIRNCTIADNLTPCPVAGVWADGTSAVTLANTIVRGGPGTAVQFQAPATVTAAFCDIEGGFPGGGNFDADPLFANAVGGDYHLTAGSPCLNVGANGLIAPGKLTDLDGTPRILGGVVDLGAFELVAALPGTGEDLVLSSPVSGANGSAPVKLAPAGSVLTIRLDSPNGTFSSAVPLVIGNLFPITAPPTFPVIYPAVHIDLFTMLVLVNGAAPFPFPTQVIGPYGFGVTYLVPPGLSGLVLRIQGAALSPGALNGIFAASDAHEIIFP